MKARVLVSGFLFFIYGGLLSAQDTVKVSLQDFIRTGIKNSGQIEYERQKVALARNRITKAQSQRYLPKLELSTQHGLVPGVKSNTNRPPSEYYLDPNLKNDWEDIGLFTRAEATAIQPVFAWGALRSLVKAAESATLAAEEQFETQKADIEIRLYELYQSYILSLEIRRLLQEAQDQIDRIEKEIDKKQKEGNSDLDESEVFKFKIFKSEFTIRAAEVQENLQYIKNVWHYVMQADPGTTYIPDVQVLEPVSNDIQTLNYYRMQAVEKRSEIKAVEAGIEAAEYGLKATKSQNYPTLFLGLTGSYANTPNRPRQSNPFIINNTNYASAAVGIGIRQNLDFLSLKADVERSQIQYNQAKDLRAAALDGIILEINEHYKNASLSHIKVEKTDEALVISKKWLRQEQLDYDFGIGDTKDLLDAMKKELELRVQLKRQIFELNKDMAELFKASGLQIMTLKINNN